ncbi:hypothetical protein H1R17_01285 [Flavobacterium sp. xlx-214]|uniref:hypothetical protein n=1 Tax=unclassified Flavobacterium TaxID=196869 RepID=UPI0013D1999C|nr:MULTISPECIES: hypothetical protein [unclassified Flavobacterium]MBA5792653.1 hypothetical protein [Flavobacterium sp. xlx-221]QMI83801.1 hypothetical protein H1R17_01285 [Flavobacterium sp. xlx-214]
MKNKFFKFVSLSIVSSSLFFASCSSNDDVAPKDENITPTEDRWITIAGAKMGAAPDGQPGDGNGGTVVYSISKTNAKNPDYEVSVYDNGFGVHSSRTARLQSSADGKILFNIQYTGVDGGQLDKYTVNGGNAFGYVKGANASQQVGTSPRWAKLFDGDKTGIAVNVTTPKANNADDTTTAFKYYRGTSTVLALDLVNTAIKGYKSYELPLSAEEELAGHHIFRLDAPVLNKAGNKLIVGTWMRQTDPTTGKNGFKDGRLGTKSLVVDYPSLENPSLITSTVDNGDTSGYRSFNAFVANDGNIYQATQRGTKGSHILRINQNNQYDNEYVFSLDSALGVTGTYVDAWRYAGNGIAYVMYTYTGTEQGFVARVDLNAKTAAKVDLPYEAGLDFGQYQGFVVDGDEVYIAVTPVGKDGNIYILNSKTGTVTKGAKLKNKPGNHYIGVY